MWHSNLSSTALTTRVIFTHILSHRLIESAVLGSGALCSGLILSGSTCTWHISIKPFLINFYFMLLSSQRNHHHGLILLNVRPHNICFGWAATRMIIDTCRPSFLELFWGVVCGSVSSVDISPVSVASNLCSTVLSLANI